MKSRLKEIHDYLISLGRTEEELEQYDSSSVYLSMEIMEYAHRDQKRENGTDYAIHPSRCMQIYRDMVGITPDDYFCIDKELLYENNIPFDGVQEVCLLHDVIEDSDLTLDDVRDIFVECGFENYFELYIGNPLKLITHIKGSDYMDYIKECLKNPISALAKMIDLQDNLDMFELTSLDERKYIRTQNYVQYIYIINSNYRFLENVVKYKKEFNQTNDF